MAMGRGLSRGAKRMVVIGRLERSDVDGYRYIGGLA